jgi:hypothetical protein
MTMCGTHQYLSSAHITLEHSKTADSRLSTPPHSHSIVLSDGSALISQRKFFQRARKNRLPDPSEICALDFKREFRRLGICSISATIGIN